MTVRTRRTEPLARPPDDARDTGFEALYIRHYRSVYRYVLGMTRSPHDTEDITAETFERALRAWPNSPRLNDTELPWLLLTPRRIATDRWRRARRFASLKRPVTNANVVAGEDRTDFWLWFDALSRVLSERQREVLLLRYQRDLTDADIGSIMGLSTSGVRSLVARSLEVLRAHPELLR